MMSNKIDGTIPDKSARKILLSFAIFLAALSLACANSRILESANVSSTPASSAPTPERPIDDVQDNLASVERMGYDFVYVITRKDGDIFSSEDITFLRSNAPSETNQWRWTEDKKTIIAATNYKFPPENLEALRKRFNVEDRSPKREESANVNTNAAQKQ